MSPQVQEAQRDFSYGIVRDQTSDPRALNDHVNGLYEKDGSPFKRGGNKIHSAQIANPSSHPGIWVFDGHFDAGRRTVFAATDDFYVLAADDSALVNLGSDGLALPAPSAMLESMLFIGGGYIYGGSRKTATYSTGTVTLTKYDGTNEAAAKTVTGSGTAFLANVDPGMLFQRGNERLYVVASVDSDTVLTLRDPYEGTGGGGITYTLHHFYKMTAADPYEAGAAYTEAANHLLTHQGKVLKFTVIENDAAGKPQIKPHKWTLTVGAKEIPNEHRFQGEITGHGTIAQTVAVLTTLGIWTIDGIAFDIIDSQGNNNHRVQVLSRELISYGQVATWEQALIVPCLSGIFLIDGVSKPRRIVHPIDSIWRTYVNVDYRPGQAAVYENHYLLPVIAGNGDVKDVLVARLDRDIVVSGEPAKPWARWGGEGLACPSFAVRTSNTPDAPLLLGANKPLARVVDNTGCFNPGPGNTLDADGIVPEWVIVTRDYETGNLTENMVRTVEPRYELVGSGATITGEYGFGISEVSLDNWDERDWAHDSDNEPADLFWEDDEDDTFFALACTFPESDGNDRVACDVNDEARFIRYRFRNANAAERLRFRELVHFIRQSKASRR
jgi:hypothetical protein